MNDPGRLDPASDQTLSAQPGAAWPIVGHEWAVRFLAQLTSNQARPAGFGSNLRHAYLFLGPPHIGKVTLARLFAQAILCTHRGARPCGVCRACGLVARGVHPDFRLIQPTDKEGEPDRINGLLRAEVAESIVHDAALHPLEAAYKVFLIQEFHQANPTFANKLLKTLEEPPPNVVLLLTASDRQQLLPTIVSRCQVLTLRPTAREEIRDALIRQYDVERERAELLARLANGRMGWAVEQLRNSGQSAEHDTEHDARLEELTILWQLTAGGSIARLEWAEKMAANRNSVHLFGMLELWLNWWRDILLYQSGCEEACNNVDQLPRIAAFAQAIEQTELRAFLATLQRIERYLHHTVNTRLALEVLALRLPHFSGATVSHARD
jgi:DNA polymerase-3 subunit delta'